MEPRTAVPSAHHKQTTPLDVSIVLPTYHRPESLKNTLDSFCHLIDTGVQWEVIVIDNGNDHETAEVATQFMEKLPLTLIAESRTGKSHALNSAIPHIKGGLCLLTDDDVLAHPDWVINTWHGAERWPHHCVFGGRILPQFPQGIVQPDVSHRLMRGAYVIANWDKPEGEYKASMVWGPNMAVRSQVFQQGFLFNTNIGPTQCDYIMGQDTEFAFRLEEAGYTPIYLPDSLVYHQIRPEQLTRDWLYKRIVKSGRSFAFVSGLPSTPLLFGIPRYMYRLLLEACVEYGLSFFLHRQTRNIKRITIWYRWGMFSQYSKGIQKERIMKF